MSQKPVIMEQLKQILQLRNDGVAIREIARRTGISRNSVKKYLERFKQQQPSVLSEVQIAQTAYSSNDQQVGDERLEALINHFTKVQKELSKTGVTRQLLWQEYKELHADGYNYSQYCYHFKNFLLHKDVAMHLEYTAGDMMMIDFAGQTLNYVVAGTGEMITCQVFVSILPYSGLIFCKAVHSQQTADFTACINAMLRFYGAVPGTILCDNLKTAVTRPSRYEPVFTELCMQLSEHYQTTFSATRPYSPRDKALVEGAVHIVYTHVYALLRNTVFTSIEDLNHGIKTHLNTLNNKPYKKTPYSRWYYFDATEKASLKPLPAEAFTIKKTVIATVQRNYHIQLREENNLYYSVPYTYIGKKVKVLYNRSTVEVYYENSRIALHLRIGIIKAYNTIDEHMPPNHRRMKEIKGGWNEEDLMARASNIGPHTARAAAHMLKNSVYMEQNYKACNGMLLLHKTYTIPRLEAACARALTGTRINYTMIKNILQKGLDKQQQLSFENMAPPTHENIRGADHYK